MYSHKGLIGKEMMHESSCSTKRHYQWCGRCWESSCSRPLKIALIVARKWRETFQLSNIALKEDEKVILMFGEQRSAKYQYLHTDRQYTQHVSHSLLQIKLTDKDNSPVSNEVIQLFVNNRNTDNFTTDHNGIAEFSIDTSEMFDYDISLKVSTKQGWIETHREMAVLKLNPKEDWMI